MKMALAGRVRPAPADAPTFHRALKTRRKKQGVRGNSFP
jgi:hypothetical protein